MTVTTYDGWVADGAPWSNATCIDDFAHTMRGHGYVVGTIGQTDTHLDVFFPEDHAPFSHTPWPGTQPYPRVLALDIMPGGEKDWRELGEKIHADKKAGVPGTEWIKYMNYTDRAGICQHVSWEPNYAAWPSNDGGHIHISARTDYVNTQTAYDPLVPAAPKVSKGDDSEMIKFAPGFACVGRGNPKPEDLDKVVTFAVDPGPGYKAFVSLSADFGTPQVRIATKLDGMGWGVDLVTAGTGRTLIAEFHTPGTVCLARSQKDETDTADNIPLTASVRYLPA